MSHPPAMPYTQKQKWIHGLLGGVIGGFAGAIDSSLALMIMVPEKFNLNSGLKTTLFTALILGLLTGAKCACAYLKQSPLPPEDDDNLPLTITKP